MSEEDRKKVIENIQPILYVKDVKASIDYYEAVSVVPVRNASGDAKKVWCSCAPFG